MNRVILVGRLTKDPELRSTASGTPVCSFTVACDRRFVKERQRVPATPPEGIRRCGIEEEPAQSAAFPDKSGKQANKPRSDARQADFINCIAWQKSAEAIAQYFHKGDRIALEGAIQTRNWTDNEGKTRYATEVVVDQWEFVQSKSETGAGAYEKPSSSLYPPYQESGSVPATGDIDGFTVCPVGIQIEDEDLPF